jgi:4-amino-4-deoxy-L-arabinose transferase-like glycosyltransferase
MKISFQPDGNARPLFWFIVLASLLLRLWGTWYGLPYSYWVDEYHEVLRALELGSGGFNFMRTGKGGFYLLLFFEYGAYFVTLKLLGIVNTTAEFARLYVTDPTDFYLLGRVTAAVLGALTVTAVFGLARHAYSSTTGIIAALFLAFNVLHADLSRRIGVDVPMTLCATFSLYFALKIITVGGKHNYVLAAVFAALATTTKLPGILLVLPLLIAHTYASRYNGGGLRTWFSNSHLWTACAVFLLVWVATNPGIVGKTGLVTFDFPHNSVPIDGDGDQGDDLADGIQRPNLYLYYLGVLADSMGWPLFVGGLAGLGYALWMRTAADVVLVSYALINYLVFSGTSSEVLYYPRYSLPMLVVVTLLAARLLTHLSNRTARPRMALVLAALACIALPAERSIENAVALSRLDSRTLAKSWIEENIPSGSHVLIEGIKIVPDRGTVQLRETPEAVQRRIETWRAREPKQAQYLRLLQEVPAETGYNLHLVRLSSIQPFENYLSQGVEYFVVRPDYFEGSRRMGSGSARLLDTLRSDPRVELLKRVEGDTKTPPGPTIEIYGRR